MHGLEGFKGPPHQAPLQILVNHWKLQGAVWKMFYQKKSSNLLAVRCVRRNRSVYYHASRRRASQSEAVLYLLQLAAVSTITPMHCLKCQGKEAHRVDVTRKPSSLFLRSLFCLLEHWHQWHCALCIGWRSEVACHAWSVAFHKRSGCARVHHSGQVGRFKESVLHRHICASFLSFSLWTCSSCEKKGTTFCSDFWTFSSHTGIS